jgi:hypothetical protein
MGYVSPDNVFMGLSELERQMGTLEALVVQERPQQREQWRRFVLATSWKGEIYYSRAQYVSLCV